MSEIIANPASRLAVFVLVFAIMAIAEVLAPARRLIATRVRRWTTNLGLLALDAALLRLVFPAAAVGAAFMADGWGVGLFAILALPWWLEVLAAIMLLDFLVWAQHVAFHKVPLFWRFHAVHHAARDLDVTAGVRFHPVEALLSMALKIACVVALGAPPDAVFLFEVLLNAGSLFSHANVALPSRVERLVRLLIVTPAMHRTHHSIDPRETDTNYGFFLSVWDRLFGVYTERPRLGEDGLVLGLAEHQDDGPERIVWSLLLPFRARRDRSGTSA